MIKLTDLTKTYNGTTVLSIQDLELPTGEVIGLVGNNGAGKTTMMSLILDLIRPSTGHVSIAGLNPAQDESWKRKVGAFVDDSFLIDFLTPDEYFTFIAKSFEWDEDQLNTFLEPFMGFFNGEIVGTKKFIRDLSKGNQKKVGIVGAFIGNTDYILLDEPFANLDPTTQFGLRNLIKERASENKTIIVSSHDLNHVAEVSDRIVLINKGELIQNAKASPTALKELQSYFAVPDATSAS